MDFRWCSLCAAIASINTRLWCIITRFLIKTLNFIKRKIKGQLPTKLSRQRGCNFEAFDPLVYPITLTKFLKFEQLKQQQM